MLNQKITRQRIDDFIQKYRSEDLVLDLGCKNSPYKSLFPNRIGLDVTTGEGVDVVGDAHSLPFEDNKFDRILCTEVLEHLYSPGIAIREMKRVLKPNGVLILTTRFIFPLHDTPNDYYRFTKYGLSYLFKDWEIIELVDETKTEETIGVLFERLMLQTTSKYKALKLVWLFFRWLMTKIKMIKKQFGDINRTKEEENIMTSGYYLVCRNIK